jgi:hypothetical protein
MIIRRFICVLLFPVILSSTPLCAAEEMKSPPEGTIVTLWPLLDYRDSPGENYRSLSVLGPLFKFEKRGDERITALRPLFYQTANGKDKSLAREYLYPLASSETSPDMDTFQIARLYQKQSYRKGMPEGVEKELMFFPLFISGTSKKYGPYTSVFPVYGDIYERFWRDEYHYVLFPLYGSTVKQGTTTRNYLYPVFSTVSGESESGFQVWPLYGQAAKEGVYSRRFILWPFFMQEQSGLDTDNPTSRTQLLPMYMATDSPRTSSWYFPWPFFGRKTDSDGKQIEKDYFWPFVRTIRGDKRNMDSYLPFYSRDETGETRKRWFLWPLYKQEEMTSDMYYQERDRVLYFLYSDTRERWPKDDAVRRRTLLWPLFVYNREPRGVSSISLPAPVEPVLDKDGIERSWAPFWRLYQRKWNDSGDSASSLLWNLFWHERRGEDLAYELFPLVDYRSEKKGVDFRFLKGLIRYRHDAVGNSLGFFWFPHVARWGDRENAEGVKR